ncbi:MAG TPA: serine protease, partial [Urbifossiella sp.]|nr:serine protease [Urbifossiella sp.]
ALFAQPVDVPPRTVRAASLKATSADLVPEIPTFHSLMQARKSAPAAAVAPKAARLTQEEVKRACAYIKVDAGDDSSTGSGYLIASEGKTGLVATNYHVIDAAARPRFGTGKASVTTVFNSGLADEISVPAQIVAFDPIADLAVLRVVGNAPWPKALSPYNAPAKVTEGTEVHFWGFPLGDILSSGKRNPEITLGKASVASLRHTASGKLDKVQINGTMNPGNSGGPLVDGDGRLVGTAVSIINPKLGAGIGFAVPVNDLIALLEGRLLTTIFVPLELEGGKAKFLVFVPVMDPLDRVDTVFIRRWAGDGPPPEATKDALTGYKPFGMRKDGKANLPGVEEFPLKKFLTKGSGASGLGIALGEMDVPLDAGQVQIQMASQTNPHPQTGAKLTAASKPVAYTLNVGNQPVGADARPFTDLTTNTDALAGKVVVVKGRVVAPPATREAVQDLVIYGDDGNRPDRMRFLVDRAAASQFDEVIPEDRPLPVRLVCLVGQRGADGVVPVRVARLDFIGRGDRVVRTIPAAPAPDDQLAALNRDPGAFAGRSLNLKVEAVPITRRTLEANEFAVLFPSHQAPRNLTFTISGSMRQRLIEMLGPGLRPDATVRARIAAVVPPRVAPPGGKTVVTVNKIEFLDEEGNPVKTIE